MFRRSGCPKIPCESDSKESAEQPEGDGEACAVLQAVDGLSAPPPCNEVVHPEQFDQAAAQAG